MASEATIVIKLDDLDDDTVQQLEAVTKDRGAFSTLAGEALRDALARAQTGDGEQGAKPVICKRVFITKDEGEKRFALAPVLEPETGVREIDGDSQGDTYSADEIEKACHSWMEAYRSGGKKGHLGEMHKRMADGDLAILENYIAPCDFSVGTESVRKGTWLMGLRFYSDEMWEAVKKGEYTGLSIGGFATRTPLAA